MRIPASAQILYDAAVEGIQPVINIASPRLQALARRGRWLFDERVKSAESCLSKLEGGAGPMASVTDLYAASIIVPTIADIDAALRELQQDFDVERRPLRELAVDRFAYDDVHLHARLGRHVAASVADEEMRERPFEVQIHTGLQYAWWRATHDQTYKSRDVSAATAWEMLRVSSQARASLELLDVVLADLSKVGALQPARSHAPGAESGLQDLAILLDELWAAWRQPDDVLRFCRTAAKILQCVQVDVPQLRVLLKLHLDALDDSSITPLGAIIVVLARDKGVKVLDESLRNERVQVCVSPEMTAIEGTLKNLTDEVIAPM